MMRGDYVERGMVCKVLRRFFAFCRAKYVVNISPANYVLRSGLIWTVKQGSWNLLGKKR